MNLPMKRIIFYLLLLLIFVSTFVHASQEESIFHYSHTKGAECAQNWQIMEEILDKNGLRCKEVVKVKGFPYLRGIPEILRLASKITTKYAGHKWLELLRRIDLQARYAELSALPPKELETFCKAAGINCIQGRIRAYVARCSAIMMGDEKTNHDFMKVLKEAALESASKGQKKGVRCFENPRTLDGIAGEDTISSIFKPPVKSGGFSNILQNRIRTQQKLKNYKPY